MIPLGVRLNNPGNVEHTRDHWKGMSEEQPNPTFVSFISPVYGFRAMARILMGDFDKGLTTVTQLISSWAPASENDTQAYIQDVCQRLNVGPGDPLDLPNRLLDLMTAITHHEQGSQPWAQNIIQQGIDLERTV